MLTTTESSMRGISFCCCSIHSQQWMCLSAAVSISYKRSETVVGAISSCTVQAPRISSTWGAAAATTQQQCSCALEAATRRLCFQSDIYHHSSGRWALSAGGLKTSVKARAKCRGPISSSNNSCSMHGLHASHIHFVLVCRCPVLPQGHGWKVPEGQAHMPPGLQHGEGCCRQADVRGVGLQNSF